MRKPWSHRIRCRLIGLTGRKSFRTSAITGGNIIVRQSTQFVDQGLPVGCATAPPRSFNGILIARRIRARLCRLWEEESDPGVTLTFIIRSVLECRGKLWVWSQPLSAIRACQLFLSTQDDAENRDDCMLITDR